MQRRKAPPYGLNTGRQAGTENRKISGRGLLSEAFQDGPVNVSVPASAKYFGQPGRHGARTQAESHRLTGCR
jgi:hypothetical protein